MAVSKFFRYELSGVLFTNRFLPIGFFLSPIAFLPIVSEKSFTRTFTLSEKSFRSRWSFVQREVA
ncbi:Uncharacterised protein [Vibrio cholerae]|uniref:Uncharacterized protein n=1 Tax=Vibrio cholerae TaxID=666 RepID=A0A655RML4_VIBCL|nr:Uncharacterised protein [Vibrio cholerae]